MSIDNIQLQHQISFRNTQQQFSFGQFRVMGAQSSQGYSQLSKFSMEEWRPVPISPHTNIKDPYYGSNFKVYANRLNPYSQVQKYDLFFNSYQEFLNYKQTVRWRNNTRYIAQVKFLREPQKQQFCGSYYNAEAFLERTPIRLTQIQDISIQEGLCIMYSALQGFQKLYSKFGYFQVEPEMVGFSKEGFVKVWVNQNLSKHHPENIFSQKRNKSYDLFVQKLVKMIEELTDFEDYETVTDFMPKCKLKNPYERMNIVLQMYAKKWEIVVPRNLMSIRNICQAPRRRCTTKYKEEESRRSKLTSLQSFISQENKRLELNRENARVEGRRKNQTMREPISQLSFRKTLSFNEEPDRVVSQTSRAPSVRFHYRNSTLPNSPKGAHQPDFHLTRKSVSTITSPERINSSHSLYCFRKSKKSFGKAEAIEIDPEIAADLAKLVQ